MKLETFIDEIFLKKSNLTDILSLYESYTEKGKVFERIGDLLIKCGFMKQFPNNKFKHIIGNINEGKPVILQDLKIYIENQQLSSGNQGGKSDITLYNENDDKYIFISSKFYQKEKHVDDYDISPIISITNAHKHIFKNFELYLMVNNKEDLMKKVKSSHCSSKYITEYMNYDKIIDLNDLEDAFCIMKNYINKGYSLTDNFLIQKNILDLKFHQKVFIRKIQEQIKMKQTRFLLGCKPRSGKTYMVGGLISEQMNLYEHESFNILIITPIPNETSSQFLNMFNGLIDFNDFKIINFCRGNMIRQLTFKNKNIIITSKQLMQNYLKDLTDDKIITPFIDLKFDYIFFDENHYGGTTDLSACIINQYSCEKTIHVFLTATYQKPLMRWNIPNECIFYWDLIDEYYCKQNDIDSLIENHGTIVKEIQEENDIKNILETYKTMPELEFITNMFESTNFQNILNKSNQSKYGWSYRTLFSYINGNFNFPEAIESWLRYISGSHKEEDFPDGDRSIYERIRTISKNKDTRTLLTNMNFTTQLWFLPFGIDLKINIVSEALKKLMLNNRVFKKYEIMILNSQIDKPIKDIKSEINKRELEAKANGKNGLILLVGNQCSLGITLEKCDIVFLMNDIMCSDKIYQMMFRSMTESPDKKCGFVVDMNIHRVLHTLMNYSLKKDMSIENKIKFIIQNHLINIDSDYFQNNSIDESQMIECLLNHWREDPNNHLKKLLNNINQDILSIDKDDQKMINSNFFMKNSGNKDKVIDFFIENQEIKDGRTILIEKNDTINNKDDNNENKEEEDDIFDEISFTKDVLPYIILLTCFLTMKENNNHFIEMLYMIKDNHYLLEVFNEQTHIWWSKINLIDMIIYLTKKYIKENSYINSSTLYIKIKLLSMIDNPKECLQFIQDHLKPKEVEKKKYGEVFTPMCLVEEMLDKLPEEVWSNSELKWFDPANGMGNFPIAVYYRLMKGLSSKIKNEEKRKKHIIENMLYMSELNKKNCFMTKQIFDPEDKYQLNLFEGDTLDLDPMKEWSISTFDIIMGNPPYNKGGIWSHTKKMHNKDRKVIWMDFIKMSFKYLKQNGYLLFIVPLYWLKINNEIHNLMLENHIMWLKIWDNSQSKSKINADIPISLFVLKNRINKDEKTEIVSELKRRNLETVSIEFLNKNYSIPLAFQSIFNKLSHFIEINNLFLEFNSKTVKSIGEKKSLHESYDKKDMWAVDTYRIKEGIMVKKVIKEHPDVNKNKLIIANKASFIGTFIDKGKLNLTGSNKYYILGDNLELLLKMFNFKLIHIISHLTKYTQDFLDKEAFKYIPDIRKLKLNDIDEDKFYKLINLNEKEINQIKEFI